jgi:RNA polymerase sigma factor (sigma-70 family)
MTMTTQGFERAAADPEGLLARFQAGDQAALGALWEHCSPQLERWARRHAGSCQASGVTPEDLAQEAFIRSWPRLHALKPRGRGSVLGYLRMIMLNQVRDHLRKRARQPVDSVAELDVYTHQGPSPLEAAMHRQLRGRYERALTSLAEHERGLVAACVEEQCSNRELAERFGKPSPAAARMARRRALSRLTRAMKAPMATVMLALVCCGLGMVASAEPLVDASSIAPGARIRVTMKKGHGTSATEEDLVGTLVGMDEHAVTLARKGKADLELSSSTITRLDVSRGEKPRGQQVASGAAGGFLGGAILGAVLGGLSGSPSCRSGEICLLQYSPAAGAAVGTFAGGVVGAALGAVFGAATHAERWERVSPRRISLQLAPVDRGARVSLRCSF